MKTCACGNVAEAESETCARCGALRTLELKAGATSEEIQNAFDVLSKVWSPDRYQDDDKMKVTAAEKLAAIDAAHSLLVRSSVQAAPFRSSAQGDRSEAPLYTALGKEPAPGRGRKTRKPDLGDGSEKRLPMPLVIGCGVVLAGVVTAWLFFEPLDSALMRIPVAGRIYADNKTTIRSNIQELKDKIAGGGTSAPAAVPSDASSGPAPSQPAQHSAKAPPKTHQAVAEPAIVTHATTVHLTPYITAGLTKSEVIAVLGVPAIATDDKLVYGASEFTFRNDSLVGWKIDPASGIRVKLWPDAKVDPNLTTFHVGSSKNEVIAVQGTPLLFSEDAFGYGASMVYFDGNRVVGWKNDRSSPLRATR